MQRGQSHNVSNESSVAEQEAMGTKLNRRVFVHQGTIFDCKGHRTATEVLRRLWNLLLGNLQKLPECSPGYPAQGILGWAGVELDGLQSSLPTSTNLWFCDFSEMQDRLFNTLNTNPMDLISAWCKYIYHAKLF